MGLEEDADPTVGPWGPKVPMRGGGVANRIIIKMDTGTIDNERPPWDTRLLSGRIV